jgi:hypothetical protein
MSGVIVVDFYSIHEHDMKAFGTELYLKMRRCLKTLEEENA